MLVSILVPIFGVEKYIEKCVVSLLEQDYKEIEYIFVNDCTIDRSIDVLKSVLKLYPNRASSVKIINHDTNKGLAAARNTAIANSSGDYVFIVDSDDWIHATTIRETMTIATSEGADIVNVGVEVHYEDRTVSKIVSFQSKEDNLLALLDKSIFCNIWGRLIKKSLFVVNGIKCIEGANMGEDFCQITKLMYFANKVSYVNEPLYNYNCMNSGGYTINYSYNHIVQVWKNYDDVCAFFRNKEEVYRSDTPDEIVKELSMLKAQDVSVVDTTAAGIFFDAGFLYALDRGASLKDCLSLGTCLAEHIVGVAGTQLSDDVWQEIRKKC